MSKADRADPKEKIPLLVMAGCVWPLGLVGLGGAIGGVLGVLAFMGNIALYRSSVPRWSLWLLNPLIGLTAVLIYFVVVVVLVMIFPGLAE